MKIRLHCCHHQYHTPYLGHRALIGCMANGVEIFHFVGSLSCFKRTPTGDRMWMLLGLNSNRSPFPTDTRRRGKTEIENREIKASVSCGERGHYSITFDKEAWRD